MLPCATIKIQHNIFQLFSGVPFKYNNKILPYCLQ